ncbi:MAG: response regulator [Nitrososphaeraceae archaeon]
MLLVDDSHEIAQVVSFYCGAKNIDSRAVDNGQEGLERIRKDKFDLILLDIAMPEFTGIDIIKSIKQEGSIESKNLVVFTASTNRRMLDEIKNSGVKEILRKPCSLDDLTELIEKYRPTTNINQNHLETLNHMNGINPLTRILLVDDDKDHLKLFTMILEGEGYSVDAYADPVTALQNFRPNYYDLALLDYLMPHLTGLELYRRIRELDSTMKGFIITATHEQLTDIEDKSQRPENLKVIRKPISNEDLLRKINSILN